MALVYPGSATDPIKGQFLCPDDDNLSLEKECSIMSILVRQNIKKWQLDISSKFKSWLKVS